LAVRNAAGVHPAEQPLTGDLADPRVVVLLAVDPVAVQLIREIGIWIGTRRPSNGKSCDHDHDA
jgi:hypothetical protein